MLTRQAGDVAPWARQTCDQAGTDRVAETNEDDRDYCCDLLCRNCGWGSLGDNDIDLESDELCSDFAVAFVASLRPSEPRLRRLGSRSSQARAFAAQRRRSKCPVSKVWRRPRGRWSGALPSAARAPRAATMPPRRPAA